MLRSIFLPLIDRGVILSLVSKRKQMFHWSMISHYIHVSNGLHWSVDTPTVQ